MNDTLQMILDYIKTNFGEYTKKNLYWYHGNDCSCTEIKTQTIHFTFCFEMNECYLEFENTSLQNQMANDFVKWYLSNVAKSAKHETKNGLYGIDNVKWLQINYTQNDDTQTTLNKIINALNADNEYTKTFGYINLYGEKSSCITLVNKKYGFKILFSDLHSIKIWNMDNATSFQNAHDLAKPIIDKIMQTANYKTYDYNFANCMFSYNMEISFSE